MLEDVPDEWLEPVPGAESPEALRERYVSYLLARVHGATAVAPRRRGGGVNGYQYVVLRCVPRVDREEFVNVGVVLYCHAEDFLGSASRIDEGRLRCARPGHRRRGGAPCARRRGVGVPR